LWLDHARGGLDADRRLGRQSLVTHEAHEAARAVAALLHFAAVGIEKTPAEVGCRLSGAGVFYEDQTICAYAEFAVTQTSGRFLAVFKRRHLCPVVNDDEIVSAALHLCKKNIQ
jgi:hypothetical protein